MDPFETTYKSNYRTYPNLPDLKCEQYRPPTRNCICDSFRTYLKLSDEVVVASPYQYHTDFLNENVKLDSSKFSPINEQVIRDYLKPYTTYRKDYRGSEPPKMDEGPVIKLEDVTKIPLTTYSSRFRNPLEMNSAAYKRRGLIVPATSLGYETRLAGRLKTKVDESEYGDRIGRLGASIVEYGLLKRTE